MGNRQLAAAVPVYISNHCDSACLMCSMNKNNDKLQRIDGDAQTIRNQLQIIYQREKVSWVMILSGEYIKGEYRRMHMQRIIETVNTAFHIGFQRITLNIGSLDDDEIKLLRSGFKYPNQVGLAVFQETYNRAVFEREFGEYDRSIPKSDYEHRLSTPERWLSHGFRMINIGILLGTGDLQEDLDALIRHAKNLHRSYPCSVQISVPRIAGAHDKCSDTVFIGNVRQIKQEIPWAEIIITTREEKELIARALPYIDVISPGTSEVLGYTKDGPIGNHPDKSQFFVRAVRERPSEILSYFHENYHIDFEFWEGGREHGEK